MYFANLNNMDNNNNNENTKKFLAPVDNKKTTIFK